jgi:hypothetical protein
MRLVGVPLPNTATSHKVLSCQASLLACLFAFLHEVLAAACAKGCCPALLDLNQYILSICGVVSTR